MTTLSFHAHRREGAAALPGFDLVDNGARRSVQLRAAITSHRTGQLKRSETVETAPLVLYGPGDVCGLDPGQIVRRGPRPGDLHAEPNYVALVEFAHPSLPWLFSPAPDGPSVMPWLALVVVDRDVAGGRLACVPGSPNPVLSLDDATLLPDLTEAWAWAHVQEREGRQRSRLLCPTGLQPQHSYLACIVPVFEAGRLAGLGKGVGDVGAALAWAQGAGSVELPVYHHWLFDTGPVGDFETLAEKLHPATGEGLGARPVLVDPVAALLQSADAPMLFDADVRTVPTAICSGDTAHERSLAPDGGAPYAPALHSRLTELIDLAASEAPGVSADVDEDPIVGPPLYGQWHAMVRAVTAPLSPSWIADLNLDPDQRTAAGTATQMVRRDQEELMTTAWMQLEQVLQANRRTRWAQLFQAATSRVHTKISGLPAARALRLTAPMFARSILPDRDMTAARALEATTLPAAALSSSFARTARFVTRTTRDRATVLGATLAVATEALARGDERVVPPVVAAPSIDATRLAEVLADSRLASTVRDVLVVDPADLVERIERTSERVRELAPAVADVGTLLDHGRGVRSQDGPVVRPQDGPVVFGRQGIDVVVQPQHVDTVARLQKLGRVHESEQATTRLRAESIVGKATRVRASVGDFASLRVAEHARETFDVLRTATSEQTAGPLLRIAALHEATADAVGLSLPGAADVIARFSGTDAEALRLAAGEVTATIRPVGAEVGRPAFSLADTAAIAGSLSAALAPAITYRRMLSYAHRLDDASAAEGLVLRRSPVHPIMAAPYFPGPAVEQLRRLDQEWVLGGAGRLEPNSVSVLETNPAFVEAFLVGANHEIARELLWRGYPTDLRGSCFRRFWPTVAYADDVPPDDITPVHTWQARLGGNGVREGKLSVIVIKGDLLRRYPATIVTAEKGRVHGQGGTAAFDNDPPDTGQVVAREVFRGWLDPDITYVALSVDLDALREEDPADHRHCWYLSFRQPLEEPRFGLDEQRDAAANSNAPDRVDEWSWQGLPDGDPRGGVDPRLRAAGLGAAHSADVAHHLYQQPFRLLLRAPDYLPEVPR